jgi:peptidoglycan hydrolase-like protein with peptidoglycan-binding domain/predicted  nucleic acid-binding Zn-ribbon protein
LEQVEIARLAGLDKLNTVKAAAEKRLSDKLPQEVREEAARLQAEYASIVNQPPSPQPKPRQSQAVEPSFDCTKAKTPLDKVICSDASLRRLDLELVQPYYVLRHNLPDLRPALKEEAVEHTRQVLSTCKLPEKGNIAAAAIKKAAPCVAAEYRRQRDIWRARIDQEGSFTAKQETKRPIEDQLELQKMLQKAGYIAADEQVDGVYGAATRTAIGNFQSVENIAPDGMMSEFTAERLMRRAALSDGAADIKIDQSATSRIADLHRRYLALNTRIDETDAKRVRDEQMLAKITAGKSFAKEALGLTLPAHIQSSLAHFVDQVDALGDVPDGTAVASLASELDSIKPAAEEASAIARATTPKNAFIVQGELSDVLMLYNDTGKAPSVVKNLRGDLVFEANRTVACQANDGFGDVTVTRQINARLSKWQQALKFPLPRCNLRSLPGYDLVVVSRGELLKAKAADLVALLSAVDSGVLAPMISMTGDEVKAALQAEAVRALEIEGAVEKAGKPGFGVVFLSTGSSVVCQVTGDDREAHENLLRPYLVRLGEEMQSTVTFVTTSVDSAFVAAKRGQCGAIYASGTDLTDLVPALRRDQIAFRYLPVWNEPEQVNQARKAIVDRKLKDVQQEADRQKQTQDEQRLAAVKASEESVVKARRQAELQQQYGAMARAFEGVLTAEMKDFVESRSNRAGSKYPDIAGWYRGQQQDHWELMTVETSLLDYGIAEFKGRPLETAFVRTNIKMRNRILGEYKETCFITGFISDQEFQMDREPVSASCEDPGNTMQTYRQGQRFTSRWLVP